MRFLAAIAFLAAGLAVGTSVGPLKNADHWSYQPPGTPAVPTVSSAGWTRNPIDHFIHRKLAAANLSPNRLADRRTLIRRLSFALHGLPPTPAAIDSFVADPSDGALKNLIDRLLKSPRYGERWARHWLDVARFSESQGYERDKIRPDAWHYRDYVINSFNDDKPYDQFVREQIAGDVIEPVTRESIKATGFLVAGPWDEVGAGQKSKVMRMRVREEELEDLISAVGQTFLGVTINCARCHDHKFDPIPQRDYYAVKAVFEGVYHGTRTYLPAEEISRLNAREKPIKRELVAVEAKRIPLELAAITQLDQGRTAEDPPPRPFLQWTFERHANDLQRGLRGHLSGGAKIRKGRLILNGKEAHVWTDPLPAQTIREKTLEAWVRLSDLKQPGGGVLSIVTYKKHLFDSIVYAERVPRKWLAGSDYFKRTTDLQIDDETESKGLIHVAISYAADNDIVVYRNGIRIGGYRARSPMQNFEAGKFLLFGKRIKSGLLKSGFLKGEIEEVRLYDRTLNEDEIRRSFELGPNLYRNAELISAMPAKQRPEYVSLIKRTAELRNKIDALKERPLVYAAQPRKPAKTHLLARGEVTEKLEVISPRGLLAIQQPGADFGLTPDSSDADRRRRFAQWLTDPRNPLTARVLVNRIWHYHFGRGLVDTPNDLGVSGSRPSHPDLLDWLAREFVASGWSVKDLHRLILSSATYLQSSAHNSRAAAQDADNRLLWRFTPRRLEAEALRDSLLALSGQLNLRMGGPGYRPFDLEINNTHFYHTKDKTGPEFNRRTIYRIGVQSLREPLLDSFDCPDLSTKTPVRGVTTTPIQALALMNDSFVQRQASFMAERVRAEAGDDPAMQVGRAYQLALGRPVTAAEAKRAGHHIRDHGLAEFCWVLMNSSEFIYVR